MRQPPTLFQLRSFTILHLSDQQHLVLLPQIFSFGYAVLAGLRGVLFTILNTRLIERLRCGSRSAYFTAPCVNVACCVSKFACTPASVVPGCLCVQSRHCRLRLRLGSRQVGKHGVSQRDP